MNSDCPRGTRKNKKGQCKIIIQQDIKPQEEIIIIKGRRCPEGTRRNKKNECEPIAKPQPEISKESIEVSQISKFPAKKRRGKIMITEPELIDDQIEEQKPKDKLIEEKTEQESEKDV